MARTSADESNPLLKQGMSLVSIGDSFTEDVGDRKSVV